MKVHSLVIDSSERDSSLYTYANNYSLHLENPIYDVFELKLVSARIPTPMVSPYRPKALILRLTSGSDEYNQTVYVKTARHTGYILLDDTDNITFNGSDDPLVHHFHSGSQKVLTDLQIEFLYMNNGELTPYVFGSLDHVLKFEITCSTDKLQGLTKSTEKTNEMFQDALSNISIPDVENPYEWKGYIYIGFIILLGIMMLAIIKRKPI